MSKLLMSKINKAILDFQMLEDNDYIAVGLSGGKDSLVLIHTLAKLKEYSKISFNLIAIHLDLGFPKEDFSLILDFLKELKVECQIVKTEIYQILQKNLTNDGHLPCSLCSKFKKALVIEEATKLKYNKVAFAHHGDDAIETIVLNALYGGRLATFRPKMYLTRSKMTFIRPLIYVREKEISNYANINKLPVLISSCPNDGNTKRAEVKELLNKLYLKYPDAYHNLLIMLSNTKKVDLWDKE